MESSSQPSEKTIQTTLSQPSSLESGDTKHFYCQGWLLCGTLSFTALGFAGGAVVKNTPANTETWIRPLGREGPAKERKGQPTQHSYLGNPRIEESGGPQFLGLQKWDKTDQLNMNYYSPSINAQRQKLPISHKVTFLFLHRHNLQEPPPSDAFNPTTSIALQQQLSVDKKLGKLLVMIANCPLSSSSTILQ